MTKKVMIGSVAVGGGEKVKIQSMTTCKTSDIEKCAAQTNALAAAGCEIIRYAVLDEADAYAIKTLKTKVSIPIVADIHFSPRLAVLAVENGADKLRINPGNIGGEKEIALVADCIKAHHIPVRWVRIRAASKNNFSPVTAEARRRLQKARCTTRRFSKNTAFLI